MHEIISLNELTNRTLLPSHPRPTAPDLSLHSDCSQKLIKKTLPFPWTCSALPQRYISHFGFSPRNLFASTRRFSNCTSRLRGSPIRWITLARGNRGEVRVFYTPWQSGELHGGLRVYGTTAAIFFNRRERERVGRRDDRSISRECARRDWSRKFALDECTAVTTGVGRVSRAGGRGGIDSNVIFLTGYHLKWHCEEWTMCNAAFRPAAALWQF